MWILTESGKLINANHFKQFVIENNQIVGYAKDGDWVVMAAAEKEETIEKVFQYLCDNILSGFKYINMDALMSSAENTVPLDQHLPF